MKKGNRQLLLEEYFTHSDFAEKREDVLGGTWVFRNSRVPLKTLAMFLGREGNYTSFLRNYPQVKEKHVKQYLKILVP